MEQKDYRLAAIMYTDIAGFSRMMERDEAGTLELLRFHNELIGGIAGSHHGSVIKTIGDALLIDFKNTVEALQSALEIQDQLYARNKAGTGLPLLVRIGLHLGDIYFFENDALGEGINIAARLQSLARPGCICFSQDVYNLVLNKIEFRAEKLGKVSLKNITKEIHAYEITSPNIEFDPDRGKPRPGYKPGSFLGGEGGAEPKAAPAAGPGAPAAGSAIAEPMAAEPERDYGPEGSKSLLAEIRRAILEDCKALRRRMSVDEAREKYGFYGVEASEVIATMAEQGILTRAPRAARPAPASGSSFDPEALGKSIEAVVHGIVGEIERSVERSKEREARRYGGRAGEDERREERHALREERREERRALRGEGGWDRGAGEAGSGEPASDLAAYREGLEAKGRRLRAGLAGNVISFLAVNALLWFLNLTTSPGFLWAAIVSAAWGIGVVSSLVAASRAAAAAGEAAAMPELDAGQLSMYRKLNRMKDSMAQHGASTLMVPLLLAVINVLTGPSFLWFLIPTAAMAVGFLSHLAAYASSKPRLQRRLLDSLGVKGGWRDLFRGAKARREEAAGLGPYAGLYREAEAARGAIASQAAADSSGLVDAELVGSLDQYLGQVRLLAQSANEIDRIVEAIPMGDLAKDKAALVAKEGAASGQLKAEYRSSIAEIEKQERSYQELREQSEVVKLRLGSSVNQLKQMRIDLARAQASPGSGGAAGVEGLKRRTDELSRYLEDLRSGYDESREDPFAALEEAERKRLADAKALPEGSAPPEA